MTLDTGALLPFALSIGGVVVAMISALIALSLRRDQINRSRFEKGEGAILSIMRDVYERQIADLNERLMATEDRWKEVNHLIIDAQRGQAADSTLPAHGNAIDPMRFLAPLGLDPREIQLDHRYAFVLTPFSKAEQPVFKRIQAACNQVGFRCARGDEELAEGAILNHIVAEIVRARVVIANISGRNSNVFYELGIAHALGKPTILISRAIETVPFDVKGRRIIVFSELTELERRISEQLRPFIGDGSRS